MPDPTAPAGADEPTPCPVDHGCELEQTCDCWCELHDVPIAECPTFALVSSWLDSRDAELERLRAELKNMTLARNGARAMRGVYKRVADRLRTELEHAKAALAGDNEGVRLWMLDCDQRAERFREAMAVWQAAAEQAEADRDRYHLAWQSARARAKRLRAELAEAKATEWHDAYQQHTNAVDAFFGELLELLPGAAEQGMDAYDQIPRGIKELLAERDALKAAVERVQEVRDQWANASTSPDDSPNSTMRTQIYADVVAWLDAALDTPDTAPETPEASGENEPPPGTYWERAVLERFITGGPVDLATVRQQVAALLGEMPAPRRSVFGGDEEISAETPEASDG